MFKSFALALATVATAEQAPTLIEAAANTDYSVVINQISGTENWTMLDRGTYGDPEPVCKNCTEKFYVSGVWSKDVTLSKVNFKCYLMGAEAYSQDYPCGTSESNDYGNCPAAEGAGTTWNGDFGFDVPPIAPPFQYDVVITAYDDAGAETWVLESKFYIP